MTRKNLPGDLLKQLPVVGQVSMVIETVTKSITRILGPTDGQAIAKAISEGLREYVRVADEFGLAKLIESQAKVLEAVAKFEEARATAYATVRQADADHLRAQAAYMLAAHKTGKPIPDFQDTPSYFQNTPAAEAQAAAIHSIVTLLRGFTANHLHDFDTSIEAPLVSLVPAQEDLDN